MQLTTTLVVVHAPSPAKEEVKVETQPANQVQNQSAPISETTLHLVFEQCISRYSLDQSISQLENSSPARTFINKSKCSVLKADSELLP